MARWSAAQRAAQKTLEQLRWLAQRFATTELTSQFEYDEHHYVRKVLHVDDQLEVALLCWEVGQSSSIHDHRGSNCVVRVLGGCFFERHFREDAASGLYLESRARLLSAGEISGVDGRQVHQITNASAAGRGAMLNFYSPPFA